ncbi:hypothetical protein MKEN_00601900 [Mycena kentingensis (nom. inval.)]|nr:hypothetical protein MKEN_00601900 [Mycena kentingensis (nom. inval.)]
MSLSSSKRHSAPRPLQLAGLTNGNGSPAPSPTTPGRKPRPSSIVYNPPARSATSLTRSNSIGGTLDRRKSLNSPSERSPVTLAEKHKDLLEFIAQKEARCLELRTALAIHEGELLQLKRKWERIVSRGFQATSPHMTSQSTYGDGDNPTSPNGGAVLDGLREGVQGVGRLIAALSPAPYPSLDSVVSPTRRSAHSTSSSTSTNTTQSTRLSQSSTSSIEEEPVCIMSPTGDSDPEVQELMVHDTGATPTMSPNPAFTAQRQRNLHVYTPDSSAEAEADFFAANATLESLAAASTRPTSKRAASTSALPGLSLVESVAPVSAWVDTVGKKWEELQRVPTVAKNTKRASLLFSDIASALQVSTPTTLTPSVSPSRSSASLLDDDSSSDAMMPQAPALTPAPVAPSSLRLSPRMTSARQPAAHSPLSVAKTKAAAPPAKAAAADSDDEWNW